jgi:hypothetical protein
MCVGVGGTWVGTTVGDGYDAPAVGVLDMVSVGLDTLEVISGTHAVNRSPLITSPIRISVFVFIIISLYFLFLYNRQLY